ncbi:MAG: PQQ-binding-like beta-propeller repeat protein [Bryobacteraceae bacterium]
MKLVSRKTLSLLFAGVILPNIAWCDWPDYRGPARNGTSVEKNLPSQWSPSGDNLAWKAPYGARSAPIVLNNKVYLMNTVGSGATLQERVMSFDADTGKVLWEHRANVYLSDVPPHRAAWASPAGDPETGNVYAFGVGGLLTGLSGTDGKVLWERSLAEEFGLVTTHGGRTTSPIIDGGLVIVSGVSTGWGDLARPTHRFFAFDKKTGQTMWVSSPGGRPFDTTYSPPVIATVEGTRLLIAGAGDGAVHAIKVQSGEPVWKFEMSKRGINTGVAMNGKWAIVSHSEENIDTSEMGLIAAIDASAKGALGKDQIRWSVKGFMGGFSSPIVDGDRVIQIDNSANMVAFDVVTGRQLWRQNLGTLQRASPVLADGKIYVGTENGKFYILRATQERCEILNENMLGTEAAPEAIYASAAVSDGRVFFASTQNLYSIGKTKTPGPVTKNVVETAPANATPAHMQVVPAELLLKPGDKASFRVRLYDDRGRFIREANSSSWEVEQLKGAIQANGEFAVDAGAPAQAGRIKATSGGLTSYAWVRVIPPLPLSEDFESRAPNSAPGHWINASGKSSVREIEGNKVLVKHADNPFTKRARMFFGPSDLSNYTVEADVRATQRRRQMGDAGVVAQRYQLTLFGNHQRLELQPWQPETERTVAVKFAWKPDTWYRLKLRVEPTADGKVKALGKAWAAGDPEPQEWIIERVDPIPNRQGSPGIYADAPFEIFFDNIKVISNQ